MLGGGKPRPPDTDDGGAVAARPEKKIDRTHGILPNRTILLYSIRGDFATELQKIHNSKRILFPRRGQKRGRAETCRRADFYFAIGW
jgi:hypothetical protein